MTDKLTIAVLSDLHAHNIDESTAPPPSFYSIAGSDSQPTVHPIAGLKKFIRDHALRADLLLCPGDITDKADPICLAHAWRDMIALKELLGANRLIATAGNHDMDSRYLHADFDPKGMLQTLSPMFPGVHEDNLCDRFWARNYFRLEGDSWQLLVLNSSAYHGIGPAAEKEYEHGRVSRHTVEAIKAELQTLHRKPVNVLLCHHHMLPDTIFARTDYSEMKGADLLLDALGSGEFGHWLVIHGHKHHPRLFYAPGGMSAPVIFCAGSLCAHIYAELQGRARNQFYLLQLPFAEYATLGVDMCGRISAWDWIPLRGWQPAGNESGLPHQSGFGFHPSFATIAPDIAQFVSAGGQPYVEWQELLAYKPQIQYMLPSDLSRLLTTLRTTHKISILTGENGEVAQLSAKQ